MSNTQQFKGRKPIRTVTLTVGSGTFIPLNDNALLEVTLQAAGGSGARPSDGSSTGGGGGGAGGMKRRTMRAPIAGINYEVGAGGPAPANSGAAAQGVDGGGTRFGRIYVGGGKGGKVNGDAGVGGLIGSNLSTEASETGTPGGAGGNGGVSAPGKKGCAPGFQQTGSESGLAPGGTSASDGGGGGGGDSEFGTGGAGGNGGSSATAAGAATGYGSGGGGGGSSLPSVSKVGSAGRDGVIFIDEYAP